MITLFQLCFLLFLADQMVSNYGGWVGPAKPANREFTLQAIEGLLYGVAGNEHAPRLHQRDATLRRPLLRALWLSSDVADLAIADLKTLSEKGRKRDIRRKRTSTRRTVNQR